MTSRMKMIKMQMMRIAAAVGGTSISHSCCSGCTYHPSTTTTITISMQHPTTTRRPLQPLIK
jgi:hypothetical protein